MLEKSTPYFQAALMTSAGKNARPTRGGAGAKQMMHVKTLIREVSGEKNAGQAVHFQKQSGHRATKYSPEQLRVHHDRA